MKRNIKKNIKKFTHACSLDCSDLCKFEVIKRGDKVSQIRGNSKNPFTKGIICKKGRLHIERLYAKDRLKKPLLKVDGEFIEITFDEALDLIAKKLLTYREEYGSSSILHYEESGAGGLLKWIEGIFFNFYGGISISKGGTCWAAGNAAQDYDFGTRIMSDIDDVLNAKTIIYWGKNPYNTSMHLYERTLRARKNGTRLVTIDPRKNESSKNSDLHINIKPSSDGALAMAITKVLIEKGLDKEYIKKYTLGWETYKEYLGTLELDSLLRECGVEKAIVEEMAGYLLEGKVSCYIGYGMQKYSNGGNSVRAIDILLAISKNIGDRGAGVFYSNKLYPKLLDRDPYKSYEYDRSSREFEIGRFSEFVEESLNTDKPIKAMFVTKCNPMNQLPNLNKTIESYSKIEFKVCIDMFMTDTAKLSDLIIPCTNTLESEDIIFSSMQNPHLCYNELVVEPEEQLMDEYYFFRELAKRMEMVEYPQVEKLEYLGRVLDSVGLTIEDLKGNDINLSSGLVAWEDMIFETESKKIEIYSKSALEEGQSPIPIYKPSLKKSNEFPLQLITPHMKNSLFNQHKRDDLEISKIYVGKSAFKGFNKGEVVEVISKYGRINSRVYLKDDLQDGVVYMYSCWNHKLGSPNFLTGSGISDMGGQVAYCDTFIKISKTKH